MIFIRNIQTPDGKRIDRSIPSRQSLEIDGSNLLLLPALIDPHVHFRIPREEEKEDWKTGVRAAIAGGVTTVFDMPNNRPPCTNEERLEEKKKLIDRQLEIPIHYGLYLGADEHHLDQIGKLKDRIVGVKVYMGSSTGGLLMNKRPLLEEVFRLGAEYDVLIAVHAEDELLMKQREKGESCPLPPGPEAHSVIRSPEVAARAVAQAIDLAARYKTRLYIAHVSSKEELDLIRQGKREGVSVYAEAAPHHLFLTDKAYGELGSMALVNPPLRKTTEPLWDAIHDGTIDTIGTDHAPHLVKEKQKPDRSAPSGFPSIELYLPLLLNGYQEGKISLGQIISLTHRRPLEIFRWKETEDWVLVDLNEKRRVDNRRLYTKMKWSPYEGRVLKGWPRYTILNGIAYDAHDPKPVPI